MYIALVKFWKINIAVNVINSKEKLVFKGQGEGKTKWYGWGWNIDLIDIPILL